MTITKSEMKRLRGPAPTKGYRKLAIAVIAADGEHVTLPLEDDSLRTRQNMRVGVHKCARDLGERVMTHWTGERLEAWRYVGPW